MLFNTAYMGDANSNASKQTKTGTFDIIVRNNAPLAMLKAPDLSNSHTRALTSTHETL
jgi:hypothetical protein